MSYPNDDRTYDLQYSDHDDYPGNDYPTQPVTYPRRRSGRTWLITGGVAVAVLVFLAGAVVACGGADERDPTAAAPASPSASPSQNASPSPDVTPAGGGGGAGSGTGGAGGGGGNPGGGHPEPDPEPDPDPEPPAPAPVQITAALHGPSPSAGCAANGTITVAGGEYPMDVTYMWFRLLGGGQPAPFSGQLTSTVAGPGPLSVTSPDFPANADQNQLQLRVLAPEAAATGVVAYPKCAEFGLSG